MPEYPLIDVDPHAGRVIRYFRSSDYAVWAASTIAVPSALLLWGEVAYHSLFIETHYLRQKWPTNDMFMFEG